MGRHFDQLNLPVISELAQETAWGNSARLPQHQGFRPFLKWAGGKSRLLSKIVPHVPILFQKYHEPFLGGGAMYFAVSKRAIQGSVLTDLNEELINAWLAVQSHGDELSKALEYYAENDSKEFYFSVRTQKPLGMVNRAARFIYLNQTSWNGLWRVNKWGQFNVPWGNRPFRGLSEELLDQLQCALSNATIVRDDFRDALKKPMRGDFVYLDPPYLPISDTSKFHLYTQQRFRLSDLVQLAEACRELSAQGVHWILSNRDTPTIRELFVDSQILSLTVRRSVAAQNVRDVEEPRSPEVIIIGKARP